MQNIEQLFIENQGILRTAELSSFGITEGELQPYFKTKQVERIRRGIYKWVDSVENEWVEVQKIVPNGVFCLHSAVYFHDLSTFIPHYYQMTVAKSKRIKPFESPPITLYQWTAFELGITEYEMAGANICVYCPERTVCDMIRFKNKVGWDSTKEVLKTYLGRKGRNIPLLTDYAKELKVNEKLKMYLEILL